LYSQIIIAKAHNVIRNILSKPSVVKVMSIAKLTVAQLKSRLVGNKPALSIIDIRDPETFNREHLTGAISVPLGRIGDLARSALPRYREIYVYGASDEQSLRAVQVLLSHGFMNVTQIIGGVAACHELARATEGIGI
jgi:rhodanese-related sulfurtransferase